MEEEIIGTEQTVDDETADDTFEFSREIFNYAIIAVVFLLVGGAVGYLIGDSQAASEEALINRAVTRAREAMSEEVATALDGIQVSSADNAQQQQRQQSLNPNERYDVVIDEQPSFGPDDAPVTMVEFSDFNCPYCGRFANEVLPQLMDEYGDRVRFVYRDYPIIGGQSSYQAALAAECANDQEAFWPYHDRLFESQQSLSRDIFLQLAEEEELDMDAFTECFDSDTHRQKILEDFQAGRNLSITGTPTFFVNGRPVIGAQPYAEFANVIEEELAAAESSSDEDAPPDEDTAS